jgi:tRNA ligase
MSENRKAPYEPQDPTEINSLIRSLDDHTQRGRGKNVLSVKKHTFVLPNASVDSWRMQDWDYKKENLPTYARGLFTRRNARTGNHEIVARGYDKFFNHGEVRKTEWPNIKKNTRGPYELSVKENGCIIFVAGLDDDTLIVCSKHSTGARTDVEKSHSVAGEGWVARHLASVGKTQAQLAKRLREMNATAVAELCDDAFEEHVLAYTPDMAGLYLHGLNLNLPHFATYPHQLVDQFADEWGFRKTTYTVQRDVDKVKAYLDNVAETGNYEGRDTEGFVIRCQARESEGAPWQDWFFKYKFEEPYLMYRQWRECTKAVIAGKPPRFKKHKKITEEYLLYARRRLIADPSLGKRYNDNHGIIGLRDDFLAFKGLKGSDIIQLEREDSEDAPVANNVILVPIATIGCGKTTLSVALCKLFGWEEFQNDNIQGKQRRPERFVDAVTMRLAVSPVVFADRNNHQKREREQFIGQVMKLVPKATLVALYWVHDRHNLPQIQQNLRERVLSRGDNHQTIHADSKSQREVLEIMDGFIRRFEPLDPSTGPDRDFDFVINLDPLASTRDNLETVVSKLHEQYPAVFKKEMPTADELDDAIAFAMNDYKPTVKHDLSFDGKKAQKKNKSAAPKDVVLTTAAPKAPKQPKVEYFAVQLEASRVRDILKAVFDGLPADRARFYRTLEQTRRIQPAFHVTLMHRANAASKPAEWDALVKAYEAAKSEEAAKGKEPSIGRCGVMLERVVWDRRIMTMVVWLVNNDQSKWESANRVAHVTIGTASPAVKPKESNDLLARWADGNKAGIDEESVGGSVVLDGTVRAVLQRF